GVDVEAGQRAVSLIRALAAGASRPEVASGVGGFAGLFDLGDGRLLAAATDGVGTKLEIARLVGRLDTVGIDLVAMCASDVACTGAEPLFFLDYLAVSRLVPEEAAAVVAGVAEGGRRAARRVRQWFRRRGAGQDPRPSPTFLGPNARWGAAGADQDLRPLAAGAGPDGAGSIRRPHHGRRMAREHPPRPTGRPGCGGRH